MFIDNIVERHDVLTNQLRQEDLRIKLNTNGCNFKEIRPQRKQISLVVASLQVHN